MSDGSTGGGDMDWTDSQPVAEAQSLLSTMTKALRSFQLYDENNPVRHRFIEALRTEFTQMWNETDKLALKVSEDTLSLGEAEVYRSDSRGDSLAFLFFKDGIREVTFTPGIQGEELEQFLGVLQTAKTLGDDLLAVLWEADLEHFEYHYVDLLAEGLSLPEPGAGNSAADMQAVLQGEADDAADEESSEDGGGAEPGPQSVSQDDFNPTLYALDPREMEILAGELRKELKRDLRTDVLSALFDRLEEPSNRARQHEILGIIATLLPNFLSRGALVAATQVLMELRKLEATEGIFDEEGHRASQHILDEISSESAIAELIQALFDGTIRASPAQLGNFLQFLRGSALSPLLHASETVEHKELQAVLRQAVQGIAARNRAAVVQLLREDDAVVASGAARMAGEMQIAEAGPALAGLLAHPDAAVRLAAIEATVSLKASTAAGALEHTLDDTDRDVRIAAARALASLRYGPAGRTLGEIVESKEIRQADISEKVAMFEAFGVVAEGGAVPVLDSLLNGKGFLGKREPTEIRAAAALGLGRVPTDAARASLQKAARDDDPVVRSNVSRALRQEGGA